jgi:hypothetical protein
LISSARLVAHQVVCAAADGGRWIASHLLRVE